jgi:acetyltransferase-like isoleucine patch superfamily enzyme
VSRVRRNLSRLGLQAPRDLEKRLNVGFLRILYGPESFGSGCSVGWGHHFVLDGEQSIRFDSDCVIGRYATIEVRTSSGRLMVGPRTLISHHCSVSVGASVRIGSDCLIGDFACIRDHDHEFSRTDMPIRLQGPRLGAIEIGSNVWLGAGVTVVKGVTIGDNVVVGAGSVVTRDIPENTIAVGVPAKVLRSR